MSNPAKPRSAAQADASRANGAKSLGAPTVEGKCKVQTAQVTHGFRSHQVVIHNEDRDEYDDHLDSYLAGYNPIDKPEEDLVGLLALNMWQVMRMNAVEAALFDLETAVIDADELDTQPKILHQYGRLALAFRKSAGDNVHELLRRYKSTAERAYHRSLQANPIVPP